MGNQDSGTNPIEEGGTGLLHRPLLFNAVGDYLNVGGVEGVEDRITYEPGPWPLRVKVRLRPKVEGLGSGESSFDQLGRVSNLRSVSGKPG